MMGGMSKMFGGGGGGGGDQGPHTEHPLRTDVPAPEMGPDVCPLFKCKVRFWVMGMQMDGIMYYDFIRSRMRTDITNPGGWQIDRYDIGYKVKNFRYNQPPEVERENHPMRPYSAPPYSKFEGKQIIGGVDCEKYSYDFLGICKILIWIYRSPDPAQPSVPVFVVESLMGMSMKYHMTEHEFPGYFEDRLFDISQYIPPPPPPESVTVEGYVRDATTHGLVPGCMITPMPLDPGAMMSRPDLLVPCTADGEGKFKMQLPPNSKFMLTFNGPGYFPVMKHLTTGVWNIPPGTDADAHMSPIVIEGHKRIVLQWGLAPRDLDLWLVDPDTLQPICGPTMPLAEGTHYYRDVCGGYGPETITVMPMFGHRHFVVRVVQVSNDGSLGNSGASVDLFHALGSMGNFRVPEGAQGNCWDVCRVDGTNVTPVNVVKNVQMNGKTPQP